MPEVYAEGQEAVAAAASAGDELGVRMVRDMIQERVCLRRPEDVAGRQMVGLVRDPVRRWWSAWHHQCHRSPYARTVALRRRVPRHADELAAVHWLMEQDPGTIDEHFAPQWSTLSMGARVHPMTAEGIAEFCAEVGLEDLPRRNAGTAVERQWAGGVLDETVRWLYGMDARIYEAAVVGTGP